MVRWTARCCLLCLVWYNQRWIPSQRYVYDNDILHYFGHCLLAGNTFTIFLLFHLIYFWFLNILLSRCLYLLPNSCTMFFSSIFFYFSFHLIVSSCIIFVSPFSPRQDGSLRFYLNNVSNPISLWPISLKNIQFLLKHLDRSIGK